MLLVHDLPENKTENTDDSVTPAISKHLNIRISEENIDRSHRVDKYDTAKAKSGPVIVKISRCNVRHKVFTNKRKTKWKGINICESLRKLGLVNCMKQENNTRLVMCHLVMDKLCKKTATKKLKLFIIEMLR